MNEVRTNRVQKFITTVLVTIMTGIIYVLIGGVVKKYLFKESFYINFFSMSLFDVVIIYWVCTQIIHVWVIEYTEKYDVFSGWGKIDHILYTSGINLLLMSIVYSVIRYFVFDLDFFPNTFLEFRQGDYLATLFIVFNILNPIGTLIYVSAINQSEDESLAKIRFAQQSLNSFFTFLMMSFFYGLIRKYLIGRENFFPINSMDFDTVDTFVYIVVFIMILIQIPFQVRLAEQHEHNFFGYQTVLILQKGIRNSINQYLIFFKEYVRKIKGKEIEFDVKETLDGIFISIKTNPDLGIDKLIVQKWLKEYTDFIGKNVNDISFEFGEDIKLEGDELEFFNQKLENRLVSLQNDLSIAKIERASLLGALTKLIEMKDDDSDGVINQIIIGNVEQNVSRIKNNRIMKIENQNIFGGNQQFADIIINNSQVLDESDSRFLQLIHENTSSPEEKKALIESLENVKSDDYPEEEKKKSGGLLRKFIDSVATEGGKQIVKEIAENGAEYWQYIS
jgi:hypothetical protein